MKIEVDKEFHHGFLLTEQELRRIYSIMTQQMARVTDLGNIVSTFEMKFKNDLVVERDSIEEIVSESNGMA